MTAKPPKSTQIPLTDAIKIASLDDLIRMTPQILKRVNAAPNGGRLFLADPIRLLGDLNVVLSPEATRALQKALGPQDLANSPLRHLYDDFKRDSVNVDTSNPIIINGIVPPGKAKPATPGKARKAGHA